MKDACTNLKKQLNRIKGQVTGIEKMIENKREVNEIIPQISAVREALSRVAVDLLRDESKTCLQSGSSKDKQQKFDNLVTTFFKVT